MDRGSTSGEPVPNDSASPRRRRRIAGLVGGGVAALLLLVGIAVAANSGGTPDPQTSATSGSTPVGDTSTTTAPTTTTTIPPPWTDLGIQEAALPSTSVRDWQEATQADRGRVHPAGDAAALVDGLSRAGAAYEETGALQDVVLDGTGEYVISAPLLVPSGVRLRGRGSAQGFADQVLAAAPDFPPDEAMVTLSSVTALVQTQIDGRDIAWRIVSAADATDVTIAQSHLHSTNSRLGVLEPPFSIAGSRPHTDIVFLDQGSERVLIDGARLEFAGISPSDGRGAAPAEWSAFSSAVSVDMASDVTITDSLVSETATAGISLFRARRIVIADNVIENVGRAVEWWVKGGPLALGDGITGYNHASETIEFGERHWVITGNRIRNSGNHGMHLSGMSIYVADNGIEAVQQTHLFFGGTLSGKFFDCVENIRVEANTLIDSLYAPGYDGGARLPKINTELVLVRHYVDATATPEAVLVEPADFSGLEPGAVTFADAPDERRCDDRMADA